MQIRLEKKADGDTILSCRRDDGSATWQRRRGAFFALHDLAHYAAETELGLQHGFFGLLRAGWNVTDFGTPWPRGPLPPHALHDAFLAESLAGRMDMERATGYGMDARTFNEHLCASAGQHGMAPVRAVTEEELERVRTRYRALSEAWHALPEGEALVLAFEGLP